MAVIVVVNGSTFHGHKPRRIPRKSVNVEEVSLKLDSSWAGLEVVVYWVNSATGETVRLPLKDPAQPHKIPWEVLADLGELRMGLVGMDGGSTVKPTIWLIYGNVVEGVDPDAGDDPQEPTPNYLAQMVQQATQANQAAQEAKEAAKNAADSLASAGPYAQAAKDAAEAAKASQDASATSARQANEAAQAAKDAAGSIGDSVDRAEGAATEAGTAKQAAETAQAAASNSAGTAQGAATTASEAAQTAQEAATQAGEYLATVKEDANNAESAALEAGKSQEAARDAAQEAANARDQANTAATSADTAKNAAEQAATTAGAAQSGAAQSAQAAANSAQAAERAKQEAQNAAAAFPAPSPEVAGMVPVVNPEGNGYIFGEAGGGGAGGELLLAEYIHQGNREIYLKSIDWETGIVECTEPHGLTENEAILLVPNNWWTAKGLADNGVSIPMEWVKYAKTIGVVPQDDTHIKIAGGTSTLALTEDLPVDPLADGNEKVDVSKFHIEVPTGFSIRDFPVKPISLSVCVQCMTSALIYRYLYARVETANGKALDATNALLGIPAFGAIVKPRHAVYHQMFMDVDVLKGGRVSFRINTSSQGRRDSTKFNGEQSGSGSAASGRENIFNVWSLTDMSGYGEEISHFTAVLMGSRPFLSNHSMVRIFAKAVKQE